MQKLEGSWSQEEMVPNPLYCEHIIPVFSHGEINKKENHVFSSILNPHNRAV